MSHDPDLAARIRALRDERQLGIEEAKRIVLREDRIRHLQSATTIRDLKEFILELI